MESKINYIIREVEPENTDFGYYFDNAGLTGFDEWYYNNVFIVPQSRNIIGFNDGEYNTIQEEVEYLLQEYEDITHGYVDARYSSVEDLLLWQGLIESVHDEEKVKAYTSFLKVCNKDAGARRGSKTLWEDATEHIVALYLSLKTGKEWKVDDAFGYSQGDHVKVIYCTEHNKEGGRHYGELWLGAGKEFYIVELDENGEEKDRYGGFIVADCLVKKDEDYKTMVCEWADMPIEETRLELIDGSHTYIKYSYREV